MSANLRDNIRTAARMPEAELVTKLSQVANIGPADRAAISDQAAAWVRAIRHNSDPTLLEAFLVEYGLSTQEGVALMCLAEALLRVPDTETIDDLIADKLAVSDWGSHSGKASSPLVNASTWALMLTGHVLSDDDDQGLVGALRDVVRRLGEPVVRVAVSQAMKELGQHFVLGETIEEALLNADPAVSSGLTHSFDMLGEGAKTDADAKSYHLAYADAITSIARSCTAPSARENPGISVKLSALHPRFEATKQNSSFDTLLARARSLAVLAAGSNMGFNIDAEESNRLEFTLDLIEALCAEAGLVDWDGFGVVVQAYGKRALATVDWLADLARRHERTIMVRLVKGAYWDTEIKRAQALGLPAYPVFTQKAATDISYIACARRLIENQDVLYPQFATHNAHSLAALLTMTGDGSAFELQRLHGMGSALHDLVRKEHGTTSRIYAPVGVHRDLLAYLVRRLLENGANSSFVHQIVDASIPPETVAKDPFARFDPAISPLPGPNAIFSNRTNSRGWDVDDAADLAMLDAALEHLPPTIQDTSVAELAEAIDRTAAPGDLRGALDHAALLYEAHAAELVGLLTHEGGKTRFDAVAEIREAVDFLRYYASQVQNGAPRGLIACISPWNFPLAIFTGQIAAALAAGNCVVAKPAEQTPAIAAFAVQLMHEAGVPASALQIVFGDGTLGAELTRNTNLNGVCFTGSLETAHAINRGLPSGAVLVAETGGINAMIVDSTALLEQAVSDVISSAFQSAGQRCSALRMLYIQADIADAFLAMLTGAMAELCVGDPVDIATDVGPIIDEPARAEIQAYVDRNDVVFQTARPTAGNYVAPTLVRVSGISAIEREVFGPVLHFATFAADEFDAVIDAINATGYGLTGAIHTRLDDRVQLVIDRLRVGNLYVNRNQIGAVVESQPFGGEGLSGTGPKAGGPYYVSRFAQLEQSEFPPRQQHMPGITGETNTLTLHPRGMAVCLGPDPAALELQLEQAAWAGCAVKTYRKLPRPKTLEKLRHLDVVAYAGDDELSRDYRQALARRDGPIVRFVSDPWDPMAFCIERHVSIDTTAAGGNTTLLLQSGG